MPKKADNKAQMLADKLTRRASSAWDALAEEGKLAIYELGEDYKRFLTASKTEREAVMAAVNVITRAGFVPLGSLEKGKVAPGTRFYAINRGKAAIFGIIGSEPLTSGFRLVGAHLDSPRLDLKPNPLYENEGLAMLKTHYYGGIKKYQWTTIPLAIHGVIFKSDGERLDITIGEQEGEPVFTITDLMPHLSKDQLQKKLGEAIAGEELNLLAGSIPYGEKEIKERVKLAVLEYLHKQYGLVEEDFISSELEAVPAGAARDIGFDRSLIGGYGQDDRSCAFAALRAVLEVRSPWRTAMVMLADKEEIGSMGNTGAQSQYLQQVVGELAALSLDASLVTVGQVMANSQALSADVNAGLDPTFDSVMEKNNAARIGGGVVLTKYTGSGGKYGSNDAHAEFLSRVRQVFNSLKIPWQIGELGKVDQGGGGTIAQYLANKGMDVVDCGPPLLSMHSPLEVISKADLYATYRAYWAFLQRVIGPYIS